MITSHKLQTFAYGATTGVLNCKPDGLAVLSVCGPVSGYVLKRLLIEQLTNMPRPLQALCLRLDRAMLAFGKTCLDKVGQEDALRVSVAIVVAPELQALFQDYAMHAAERGYTRVVFTSPTEAMAWSAAQAKLAQAQSVWLARQAPRALLIAA